MTKPLRPRSLSENAVRVLGPAATVAELGSVTGNARTWLWEGEHGSGVAKVYRSHRTFRQELHAYQNWTPRLPHVAALLGFGTGSPPWLLFERLAGVPVSKLRLSEEQELALHAAAGVWLARLHELPIDDDDIELEAAYRLRWQPVWEESLALALPTPIEREPNALRFWVGDRLRAAIPALRGSARVPCHRDYTPANWLADASGSWVGVVDFEHARPDHPLADLARLAAYVWPVRPDLRAAFQDGYGPLPGSAELLDAMAVSEAWHRYQWGCRHDAEELIRAATTALSQQGAPVSPGEEM